MDICTRSLKSFFGYLTARPPVTIFVLCIAGLAMGFISLSFHIQYNNAINYEASKEYLNILNKFTDVSFCLTAKTAQVNTSDRASMLLQHGITEFVNITLPVSVSFKKQGNSTLVKSISQVTGVIPYFYVFTGDDHMHSLLMHVFLRSQLKPENCKENVQKVDACINLTVKKDAIPLDLPSEKCTPMGLKGKYSVVHMAASSNNDKSQCMKGLKMNINNNYIPIVYLNLLDKAKVHLRLNVVSYVLFVLLLLLVLYAIMRGNSMNAAMKIIQR